MFNSHFIANVLFNVSMKFLWWAP